MEPGDNVNTVEQDVEIEADTQDIEMQSMARYAYYGIKDDYMQTALDEWSD